MGYEREIEELREEIDHLNGKIVEKLSQRVKASKKIGDIKRRHDLPIVDRDREARVYEQIRGLARRHGLDETGVVRIFREIIRLCTEAQM